MTALSGKIPEYVMKVVEAMPTGATSFLVGGCVRDLLMGRTPKDYDMATSASPDVVMVACGWAGLRVIETGVEFGTVTVISDDKPVEVTTFRSEGTYTDGRRPTGVTFSGVTAEEDLSRRDFTMNAIGYDPHTDTLIDPFGGVKDIETQTIRAVGNAKARFAEDRLRILRGLRFASQLGFNIHLGTLAAMADFSLKGVSAERVGQEIEKMLLGPNCDDSITAGSAVGVLSEDLNPFCQHLPAKLHVRMAQLVSFMGRSEQEMFIKRLRLPGYVHTTVERLHQVLPDYVMLSKESAQSYAARLVLHSISRAGLDPEDVVALGDNKECEAILRQEMANSPPVSICHLAVSGTDLVHVFGAPGRHIGVTLDALLALVLKDPASNTRDVLLAEARRLAASVV